MPGQVEGAQVAADDLQALALEMGMQAAPAAGEIEHPAAGRKVQQGRQRGALQGCILGLVSVNGEIGGMVEIPDEPVHPPSLLEARNPRSRKAEGGREWAEEKAGGRFWEH